MRPAGISPNVCQVDLERCGRKWTAKQIRSNESGTEPRTSGNHTEVSRSRVRRFLLLAAALTVVLTLSPPDSVTKRNATNTNGKRTTDDLNLSSANYFHSTAMAFPPLSNNSPSTCSYRCPLSMSLRITIDTIFGETPNFSATSV
jgi:hypothetical protein